MRLKILLGGLGTCLLLWPTKAWSDLPIQVNWRGSGGWGSKGAYCKLYDTKTIETHRGTVVSVDAVTPIPGMSEGLELQLKTDQETITVHLGPRWYVENQDIIFQPQDVIEVTGSRINCEGQRIMAAAQVRKGDQLVTLRDAKGRPLWVVTNP